MKGIIYLHPIIANRARPEEDFYKLNLDNVPTILITTFWAKGRNPKHESRMEELEANWKRKGIPGPPPRRYDRTPDAAWDIVSAISTENGIDMQQRGAGSESKSKARLEKPLANNTELSSKDVVIVYALFHFSLFIL